MRPRHALLCCILLAACGAGSTEERPLPAVTLLTTAQWSAGRVQVESEAFRSLDSLPDFTIAAETLLATRLPAGRVELTLPHLASGLATIVLHRGDDSVVVGGVQVYGLGAAQVYPINFGHDIVTVPGDRPHFLAMGDSTFSAALLDPTTGTLQQVFGVSPLQAGGYVVGPLSARYVAQSPGNSVPAVWSLFPAPAHLDTVPQWDPSLLALVPLTDSTWLGWNDQSAFALNTASGASTNWTLANTARLVLSPRGDLATVAGVTQAADPVPVIEVATGGLAFSLGAVTQVAAGTFSPSGDTLIVAVPGNATDSLRWYETTGGAALASVALPADVRATHLSIDPRNARLVVLAAARQGSGKALLVYDRFTRALEARLQCPAGCAGEAAVLVAEVDTVSNRAWMVGYGGRWNPAGGGVPVIGFDLLP